MCDLYVSYNRFDFVLYRPRVMCKLYGSLTVRYSLEPFLGYLQLGRIHPLRRAAYPYVGPLVGYLRRTLGLRCC